MSGLEIVFLIVALITLYAALEVVTTNNLIHAALWLIVALLGVAAIFILLNATFLAVVQVMVYIGAIAILLIFAIMLTRNVGKAEEDQVNKNWPVAAVFGFLMFAGLAVILIFSGRAMRPCPLWETVARQSRYWVRHWFLPMDSYCLSNWLQFCCWRL